MEGSKRAILTLTTLQKRQIIDERDARKEEGKSATLAELAQWAKTKFRLQRAPGKSTMSRILAEGPSINANANKRCIDKTKRNRKGRNHLLEQALFDWVIHQQCKQIAVSGDIIKAKAKSVQEAVREKLPQEEQSSFEQLKFSDGWLGNFKKRWNLRLLRSYGERGDADVEALAAELPKLKEVVEKYDPKDIFNADECGLFYSMPPERSISRERLPGRKKAKERITFMPCANADGSEKLELMVIGKARNPRCFQKKSGQELGFDYHANQKAWMTTDLFFQWLARFQTYVAKSPDRKVLLLIDNCSAHGKKEALPCLPNIRVEYFPPNCTSIIQPMDAGIIAALKLRYKRRHMERALENMEVQTKHVYKVDVLTAMKWFKSAWNDLPSKAIKNCWIHTKLIYGEKSADVEQEEIALASELRGQVQDQMPASARVDEEAVVSPEGENDGIIEDLTEEHLVEAVLAGYADVSAVVEGEQENQDTDDEEEVPKPQELLRALALVRREAEREIIAGLEDFLRVSKRLQDGVRARARAAAKQTTIDMFFN